MPSKEQTRTVFRNGSISIGPMIEEHAHKRPDANAILAPNRIPLTYAGLDELVKHVVRSLQDFGIGREDRVAALLPNGPDMATAFISTAAGATFAPLNPALRKKELDFYLSDLKAKALLIQEKISPAARDIAYTKGIPIIELLPQKEAGFFKLKGDRFPKPKKNEFAAIDDVALVLHTSGTTAKPKIVPLTQHNLYRSAINHIKTLELGVDDSCLNVMPLFHIHGLISVILSSLVAGSSVVCLAGFDCLNFPRYIEEFSPTWYTASPTIHQGVLDCLKHSNKSIENYPFRFIRSAAAPLPIAVLKSLQEEFKVPVIEAYGMTEAAGQICSNPLPPKKLHPGSVGLEAGPQVAIMDENEELVPPGCQGEIVIRGENVITGYENASKMNDDDFTDGWLKTGDLGEMNTAGYFFIKGRKKQLINRGGKKINPREVDESIMQHPDVKESITFGITHRTLGEDVVTAIVPRKESAISADKIRSFAFNNLAGYKVPCHIEIVEEIPKSGIGKPNRNQLRETLGDLLRPLSELPRNEFEQELADIWMNVLGVSEIRIKDNFFMLGGDSISAVRMVNEVRFSFEVELPLVSIFENPTFESQAALIVNLSLK